MKKRGESGKTSGPKRGNEPGQNTNWKREREKTSNERQLLKEMAPHH